MCVCIHVRVGITQAMLLRQSAVAMTHEFNECILASPKWSNDRGYPQVETIKQTISAALETSEVDANWYILKKI